MRPLRTEYLELKPDHGWTSEPGCRVFVADGGAVRFDFPQGWVIEAGDNHVIRVLDRPSPNDTCRLEMTLFYLRDELDFSGVTLPRIVRRILSDDNQVLPAHDAMIVEESRRDLALAWSCSRGGATGVTTRVLAARRWNIQAVFVYRHNEKPSLPGADFWTILLKTLVLGDYVEDPTQRVCLPS